MQPKHRRLVTEQNLEEKIGQIIEYDDLVHLTNEVTTSAGAVADALDQVNEIAGLTGEDGAVSYLVRSEESETRSALNDAIAEGTKAPGDEARARAFDKRGFKPINMVLLGDSQARGLIGTTNYLDRYANRLEKGLQDSYNPVDVPGGYNTRAGDLSLTRPDGVWAVYSGTPNIVDTGLGNESVRLPAGATIRHTAHITTGITIYYTPNSGGFTVQFGKAPASTIIPNAAGRTYVPAPSRDLHTITITGVNNAELNTIYVHDGDEELGVKLFNAAKGGYRSAYYLIAQSEPMWSRIAQLDPSVVIIQLGGNEHSSNIPPTEVKANMEAIFDRIAASTTVMPWVPLILKNARFTDTYEHRWEEYVAVYEQLERDYPEFVTLYDLGSNLPQSVEEDLPGLIMSDGTHLSGKGQRFFAQLISDAWALPESPRSVQPAFDSASPIVVLDADTLTGTNGSVVTQWDPTDAGHQQEPLYATGSPLLDTAASRFNGHQSVLFADGGYLTAHWPDRYLGPHTIIYVLNRTRNRNSTHISAPVGLDAQTHEKIQIGNTNEVWQIGHGVVNEGNTHETESDSPSTGPYLHTYVLNGDETRLYFAPRNTKSTKTPVTKSLTMSDASVMSGIRLGASMTGTTGNDQELRIAYVEVWGRALAQSEVAQRMAELGTKYGVTTTA